MVQVFKVQYVRDADGYACNEVAAWPIDQVVALLVSGKVRIANDEPEREALEASVRAYRAPRQSGRWELTLVQPRFFDFSN
jgi:hypothetical protein